MNYEDKHLFYRKYYGEYDDIKIIPIQYRYSKYIYYSAKFKLDHLSYSDNRIKKITCTYCNGKLLITDGHGHYFGCNNCKFGEIILNSKEEMSQILEEYCFNLFVGEYKY